MSINDLMSFERPMTIQEVKEKITDFIGNAKFGTLKPHIDINYGNFVINYHDKKQKSLTLNKVKINNDMSVNEEHWKNWIQEIKEEFADHLLEQFRPEEEEIEIKSIAVKAPEKEETKKEKKARQAKEKALAKARKIKEKKAKEEADQLPMSDDQAKTSERPTDPQ